MAQIETKFNIGDQLWAIRCSRTSTDQCTECKRPKGRSDVWEVYPRAFPVHFISAVAESEKVSISYDWYYSGGWDESDCFLTQEEAQAECAKRNEENDDGN